MPRRIMSKKKSNISNIILVIILLVGLSLLLYPTISEYINSKHQTRVVQNYNDITSNMDKDEVDIRLQEAVAYNEKLAETEGAFYKPELVEGYDTVLDITGTGIMGYVSIPKINVELPIYHGVDEGVLQIAAGHLPGTSLPIGGPSTHAVLSGHRGLPSAMLFTDLDKLEVGDTFQVTVLKDVYTFQVDQIKIVLPYEVDDLQIEKGKEYCTLMTCTPYGVNSHRLLVRGVKIDSATEGDPHYVVNEANQIDPVMVMPVVAAPMVVILIIFTFATSKKKKNKNNKNQKS